MRAGEIVGLAGLMGAGRTELARSVFGRSLRQSQRAGTLILKTARSSRSAPWATAIDAGLAYVTEDRKGLGLNLLDAIKTSISSAALSKLGKGLTVDERKEVLVAERLPQEPQHQDAQMSSEGVSKLSGGNQQKVVLSKWMFTDPQLLILDEPTRGIDVGAKYEIYEIIHAAGPHRARGPRDLVRAARAARPL